MSSNKNNPGNFIATGIFLIGSGLLFLAYKMGAPFPSWFFTWPTALIAVGFYLGLRQNFRSTAWLFMIGIGAFSLYDQQVPDLHLKNYIWPLIIIAVGITFLFRGRKNFNKKMEKDMWNEKASRYTNVTDDGEFVNISCVFSGTETKVVSKNFKGGRISCFMGGTEIDLTQADIQGVAVIDISQLFGGTKLMIPPHWNLKTELASVFAGLEDKRQNNTTSVDNTKTLLLAGSSIFAGIEITSY